MLTVVLVDLGAWTVWKAGWASLVVLLSLVAMQAQRALRETKQEG